MKFTVSLTKEELEFLVRMMKKAKLLAEMNLLHHLPDNPIGDIQAIACLLAKLEEVQ